MQKTVWKYPIKPGDYIELELPIGAMVLTVQEQNNVPCLWALVDPDSAVEVRRFRLAGTGHLIDDEGLQYIGTFQLTGGLLVFHLFEIPAYKMIIK